jgi:zinc and cadmium transporter
MNIETWIYSLTSAICVSLVSFVGVATFALPIAKLKQIVLLLVSFSAGALMGDVFIHILPEVSEQSGGFTIQTSLYVLGGIISSFIMEKIIAWRHCHLPIEKNHVHRFISMNIMGDALHNFIDGLIIGASYIVNIPLGISSTIAIALHEIPQEIGDFGVLIHGGFDRKKALLYNFFTALTAIVGVIVVLTIHARGAIQIESMLLPFAAGTFIYIAGSDLIPELHKESNLKSGLRQTVVFLFGVLIMTLLLFID